jgi:hypothetical protein
LALGVVGACTIEKVADDDDGGVGGGGGGDMGPTTSSGTLENQPPIGVDDTATVMTGQMVSLYVLSNDSDPNTGDILKVSAVTVPGNGTASVVPGGLQVSYTANGGFVGEDSFMYTVADAAGLTAEATVTIDVTALPTLVITGPTGTSILNGPDVEITFQVNGCNVSAPGDDASGCHVHKYLDGMEYKDAEDKGFGHYSPMPFTISALLTGTYEFQLQLIKNDGSDMAFSPLIEDTVTFEVE